MTIIAKLMNAFAARSAYNKTYSQLSGLSDHMLADLGIMRHEIKAVAAGKLDVRAQQAREITPATNDKIADILPLNPNTILAVDIRQLATLPKAA